MSEPWLALVESNTTGTGRQFCVVARSRGLRPILLARDPDRYPYLREDDVAVSLVDTGELTEVLRVCIALAGDGGLGGVTSSSEYFAATAARAAAALGLPAPDGDAVERCRSKELQRQVLLAARVPVPRFAAVADVPAALAAADAIGYPVVLKPVAGSGSVGVQLCQDRPETHSWASELLSRVADERGAPVTARILVEAVVPGPEFSVETFDGAVVAVVAKHLGPEPNFVETGHDVPAPLSASDATAVGETALAALAALGLGWGAAHTELRLTPDGPVIIEVNPRLAGGMIPTAVRAAIGVDLIDGLIARVSGGKPTPRNGFAGHAAVRFGIADGEGRVAGINGLPEAGACPGVVSVTTTTAVGRAVRLTHSFQDRLTCVVATGSDTAEAAERAGAALAKVTVDLVSPAGAVPSIGAEVGA